mgnify:CR=1 FL=1
MVFYSLEAIIKMIYDEMPDELRQEFEEFCKRRLNE